jgi:hypothetical protein
MWPGFLGRTIEVAAPSASQSPGPCDGPEEREAPQRTPRRELRRRLAEFETWERDKLRCYELKKAGYSAFVYQLKPTERGFEHKHVANERRGHGHQHISNGFFYVELSPDQIWGAVPIEMASGLLRQGGARFGRVIPSLSVFATRTEDDPSDTLPLAIGDRFRRGRDI